MNTIQVSGTQSADETSESRAGSDRSSARSRTNHRNRARAGAIVSDRPLRRDLGPDRLERVVSAVQRLGEAVVGSSLLLFDPLRVPPIVIQAQASSPQGLQRVDQTG